MDLVCTGSAGARAPAKLLALLLFPPSRFPVKPFRTAFFTTSARLPSCSTRAASLVSRANRRPPASRPPPPEQTALREAEYEEEEDEDEEKGLEDEISDGFEDEILMEDDEDYEEFEEEEQFEDEEAHLFVGDGAAGGGISLAGTWWDKKALAIAEEVSMSFNGDLKIYAFKTSANSTVRLRIEKLSTKYGSPSMDDIETFSTAYRSRLDEAELAGTIPENITLEVSSPGLERVVRVAEELERFKDRAMYVKYVVDDAASATPQENDGVFRLISYDTELRQCTWGIADVKVNREKAGKGRPLSKKQREWRLQTPFESLRLVRLHSDL